MLSASLDGAVVFRAVASGVARRTSRRTPTARRSATPSPPSRAARRSSPPRSRPASPTRCACASATTGPRCRRASTRSSSARAGGASAPEIAGELQISTATVKTHLRNLYEKLGVSERAAAVAEAMRRGLLR